MEKRERKKRKKEKKWKTRLGWSELGTGRGRMKTNRGVTEKKGTNRKTT
jgi:hypothetical protein